MKLLEIDLSSARWTKIPNTHSSFREIIPQRRRDWGGDQAYVSATGVNTVTKTIDLLGRQDSILHFLRLCQEHEGNPYFPKIYKAKVYAYVNNEGRKKYGAIVQMERLVPSSSPKLSHIWPHILRNLGFNDRSIGEAEARIAKLKSADPANIARIYLLPLINSIEGYGEELSIVATRGLDPQFIEAVNVMLPVIEEHQGTDLGVHNFMFRLTSTGPQLVFIDPYLHMRTIHTPPLITKPR